MYISTKYHQNIPKIFKLQSGQEVLRWRQKQYVPPPLLVTGDIIKPTGILIQKFKDTHFFAQETQKVIYSLSPEPHPPPQKKTKKKKTHTPPPLINSWGQNVNTQLMVTSWHYG